MGMNKDYLGGLHELFSISLNELCIRSQKFTFILRKYLPKHSNRILFGLMKLF